MNNVGPIPGKPDAAPPLETSGSAEMSSLAASFARVRLYFTASETGSPDFAERVRKMIDAQIEMARPAGEEGWIHIYEMRRLSILLLNPDEILQAIISTLQELTTAGVPAGSALQKAFDDLKDKGTDASVNNRLRNLLLDMVEAIQWQEQKRHLTRRKTKEAAYRLVWCWAITFVLFIFPYVYTVIAYTAKTDLGTWTAVVPWTVLASGLMGALFSRLIFLQSNWRSLSLDQVEDAKLWSSILLRGSVGMCGAVLIFLFVRSGIAGGSLLPDFSKIGLTKITALELDAKQGTDMKLAFFAPTLAFSLLIIWCFLAGFSERFVPDILAATERKLSDATSKK